MNTQTIANRISTTSITTSAQGSWKWQDAYRISTYRAHLTPDGRVLWRSVDRSGKWSAPQLHRAGMWDNTPHYRSLHHKPVSRREAIALVGISRVRALELRGWRFLTP